MDHAPPSGRCSKALVLGRLCRSSADRPEGGGPQGDLALSLPDVTVLAVERDDHGTEERKLPAGGPLPVDAGVVADSGNALEEPGAPHQQADVVTDLDGRRRAHPGSVR